tara:strand:+ start:10300 stop:11523 length:1224 start_codon:yes stop_codon:yes gene_type:complete
LTSAVSTSLEPREHTAIWLIGSGHLVSHFYHMVLPMMFPFVVKDLGVSVTEIAFSMTLYFVSTAIVQVPIGLLVDRVGARLVLVSGMALMGLAMLVAGLIPDYYVILAAAFVAGIGNAVFHPADFSILSASVRESHHGRAFASHTFGGSIGYAAAPAVLVPLGALVGWQTAVILSGLLGIAMAIVIALFGKSLRDENVATGGGKDEAKDPAKEGNWRIMLTRPLILFFLFYVATSASGTGMTSFAILALPLVYDVTPEIAGVFVTCFLTAAIVGSLPGGWLADWARLEYLVVVACFLVLAGCLVLLGTGAFSIWLVFAAGLVGGCMRGLYNASRDILVRRSSPPGSVGTAFGFVTLGYTLGQGGTPLLYGWLMDSGLGQEVFYASALFAFIAMLIVLIPGQGQKAKT